MTGILKGAATGAVIALASTFYGANIVLEHETDECRVLETVREKQDCIAHVNDMRTTFFMAMGLAGVAGAGIGAEVARRRRCETESAGSRDSEPSSLLKNPS